MRLAKMLTLILAISVSPYFAVAQTISDDEPERRVVESKRRPDLAVDYSHVARFKLAARKSTYHLGEMITLEAAMLNGSNQPIFFDKLDPQFSLYDEYGRELKVQLYGVACKSLSPNSFELIEPNFMIAESVQLLAGFDKKAFERFAGIDKDKDEKRTFDNNLFVDYGSACLMIDRPGSYTIKARQRNQYVIESPSEPGIKTAVGTLETEPLKITIIE